MRRRAFLAGVFLAWSSLVAAETTVQVGVGTSALQFDFLYSDYGVDRVRCERDARNVGEADFLVALHLSRLSGFDIDAIIRWRRDGLSWDTITRNCRRDAVIYYVELPPDVTGPPYGRAHGYWKKHGKRDLELTDAEVRELVLVQALAAHSKVSPAQVVRARAAGKSAKEIAGVSGAKAHKEDAAPPAAAAPGKGHGKGKAGKGRN